MSDPIANLAVLEPPSDAVAVGLAPEPLRLRRAWPRSPGELALEYGGRDHAGRPAVTAAVWSSADGLTLVPANTDTALPGLAGVLAEPDAQLVSHRAGRRAVVELPDAYAKVIPPRRAAGLAERLEAAEQLPVVVPHVVAVNAGAGVVRLAALRGTRFAEVAHPDAAANLGRTLRAMHSSSPADRSAVHTEEDERETVLKWIAQLDWLRPELASLARERAEPVLAELAAGTPAPFAAVHRDLHEGQVVVCEDGSIGILDFDTFALGEPAVDVANLLVHLELAVLLGDRLQDDAGRVRAELLAAYDLPPETAKRVPVYADATRVRLTCVHSFRPGHEYAARELLDRVGSGI